MPRPLCDSVYLYGLHDPGGERVMLDLDVPGWIVFTEELGFDPNNTQGKNFSQYSDKGLGVLVRLNAGYAGTGTLPFEQILQRLRPALRQLRPRVIRRTPLDRGQRDEPPHRVARRRLGLERAAAQAVQPGQAR